MRLWRQFLAVICAALIAVGLWQVLAQLGPYPVPPLQRERSAGQADPAPPQAAVTAAEPEPARWALARPRPTRPSETLAAAVADAAAGQVTATATLFADRARAAAFVSAWRNRLPQGSVSVAHADQVDAAAGEGHLTPITVWISGDDRVAGLEGEMRLAASPAGPVFAELQLRAMPLRVDTWTDAARRLNQSGLVRSASPFYGRFRFEGDAGRWAVDARTGLAEAE